LIFWCHRYNSTETELSPELRYRIDRPTRELLYQFQWDTETHQRYGCIWSCEDHFRARTCNDSNRWLWKRHGICNGQQRQQSDLSLPSFGSGNTLRRLGTEISG